MPAEMVLYINLNMCFPAKVAEPEGCILRTLSNIYDSDFSTNSFRLQAIKTFRGIVSS